MGLSMKTTIYLFLRIYTSLILVLCESYTHHLSSSEMRFELEIFTYSKCLRNFKNFTFVVNIFCLFITLNPFKQDLFQFPTTHYLCFRL